MHRSLQVCSGVDFQGFCWRGPSFRSYVITVNWTSLSLKLFNIFKFGKKWSLTDVQVTCEWIVREVKELTLPLCQRVSGTTGSLLAWGGCKLVYQLPRNPALGSSWREAASRQKKTFRLNPSSHMAMSSDASSWKTEACSLKSAAQYLVRQRKGTDWP